MYRTLRLQKKKLPAEKYVTFHTNTCELLDKDSGFPRQDGLSYTNWRFLFKTFLKILVANVMRELYDFFVENMDISKYFHPK